MMRRAFSASVFVIHEDRVLLIKHKLLKKWLPPGGELEPGETPAEAALRELKEETGLVVAFEKTSRVDGVPAGFIAYEEHDAGPKGWHMNFVFAAVSDTMEVKGDGSFSEYQWWKPEDVLRMSDEQTSKNVRDIVLLLKRGMG